MTAITDKEFDAAAAALRQATRAGTPAGFVVIGLNLADVGLEFYLDYNPDKSGSYGFNVDSKSRRRISCTAIEVTRGIGPNLLQYTVLSSRGTLFNGEYSGAYHLQQVPIETGDGNG